MDIGQEDNAMPLGILQINDFTQFMIDVWNDKIFYQAKEFPAGFMATSILNIPEEELPKLIRAAGPLSFLFPKVANCSDEEVSEIFRQLREQITHLTELFWKYPPFCYNDYAEELERINFLFGEDAIPQIRIPNSDFRMAFLKYCFGIVCIPVSMNNFYWAGRYFELDYLRRLRKRNETYFALAAHDCFTSERFWAAMKSLQQLGIELFTLSPELSSTYVFARNPKNEKEMIFVERVIFTRLVDFYAYDLMNGLHHGHAPSQCQGCGKYFLTINDHSPKYCDGIAPQDSRYTCRQYGAMAHQKEQNKQHPVYRLFATRTDTIRKKNRRGKISDALRQEALHLAEGYRDRALMDNVSHGAGGDDLLPHRKGPGDGTGPYAASLSDGRVWQVPG